jgi:methyl-accepting chemotaxis protein
VRDWFMNRTIGIKVQAIIGLLLVVFTGAAGLTYDRLVEMTRNADSIEREVLPATRILGRMTDLAERFRLLEAESIFTIAPAEMNRLKAEMAATDQAMTELEASLAPQLPAASQALLSELRQNWAGFAKTGVQTWQYSSDNDDVFARRTYQKDAAALYQPVQAVMTRLVDANVGDGDRAAAASVASAQRSVSILVVTIVTTWFGGILALLFLNRALVAPLRAMTAAMRALAAGVLDVVIPVTNRRDELGEMAAALVVFQRSEAERRQLVLDQVLAARQAETQRQTLLHDIAGRFEGDVGAAVETVCTAATQLAARSRAVADLADRTGQQSASVAGAAEQASTNVHTVASASEELSASISEVGSQITRIATIARDAVRDAEQTDRTMQELAGAAERIGAVVQLIGDVASQTNLLALNATIEAARAGVAGKGFAVVASEVKALATQTGRATQDIQAQIAAIQKASAQAVGVVRGIGTTIAELDEIAGGVAAAVEQQRAATEEIARSVTEAAAGTREVSSSIGLVSEAAASTDSAMAEVLGAAETASQGAGDLKSAISRFLAQIRAA